MTPKRHLLTDNSISALLDISGDGAAIKGEIIMKLKLTGKKIHCNIGETMAKTLYLVCENRIQTVSHKADDQTCHACHQAGEATTSRVWHLAAGWFDTNTQRWRTDGAAQELCEDCLLDDGFLVLATSAFEADALAQRYSDGLLQTDNVIYDGVTVGAIS